MLFASPSHIKQQFNSFVSGWVSPHGLQKWGLFAVGSGPVYLLGSDILPRLLSLATSQRRKAVAGNVRGRLLNFTGWFRATQRDGDKGGIRRQAKTQKKWRWACFGFLAPQVLRAAPASGFSRLLLRLCSSLCLSQHGAQLICLTGLRQLSLNTLETKTPPGSLYVFLMEGESSRSAAGVTVNKRMGLMVSVCGMWMWIIKIWLWGIMVLFIFLLAILWMFI